MTLLMTACADVNVPGDSLHCPGLSEPKQRHIPWEDMRGLDAGWWAWKQGGRSLEAGWAGHPHKEISRSH